MIDRYDWEEKNEQALYEKYMESGASMDTDWDCFVDVEYDRMLMEEVPVSNYELSILVDGYVDPF